MTRHRQHVDDHAEVADLLDGKPDTVPAPRTPAWSDSSPNGLLDAVGPVEHLGEDTCRAALLTVADNATSAADLRGLVGALGLTSTLHAWDDHRRADAALTVPAALADAFATQDATRAPRTAPCAHPDPFVAWHPDGTAYALCEACGTTWDRQPCEACGAYVAAIHIARTGRARHANHPEPAA